MATTTDAPADAKGKGKAEKKSKKKLIIMIVGVLAVVGIGYKMFLAPKPKPGPPVGGEVVAMDATTLNLADGHYLKLAVSVQLVKGKATAADFQTSEAASLVIDEFANRTVADVSSNEKRQKLTEELQKKVEKAYEGEVFKIFVTQFVTQ